MRISDGSSAVCSSDLHDGIDAALGGLGVITEEFAGAVFFADVEPDLLGRGITGPGPGLARLGALRGHRRLETVEIDRQDVVQGRRWLVCVDLGGRGALQQKKRYYKKFTVEIYN